MSLPPSIYLHSTTTSFNVSANLYFSKNNCVNVSTQTSQGNTEVAIVQALLCAWKKPQSVYRVA